MSRPPKVIVPEVTGARPSTARAMVDLPEPDSPTRPTVSPGATCSDTPSMARCAVRGRRPP